MWPKASSANPSWRTAAAESPAGAPRGHSLALPLRGTPGKDFEVRLTTAIHPVAAGEIGEVVVTSFNPDYPMIRLATGDLSAVRPGKSPCGRTNVRLAGWMGRADQATKIKGMFVYPTQVAEIGRRHPELGRLRLAVTRGGEQDVMTLHAEYEGHSEGLKEAVAATMLAVTKLRGEVVLVAPGSLPNDGKVIADERPVG